MHETQRPTTTTSNAQNLFAIYDSIKSDLGDLTCLLSIMKLCIYPGFQVYFLWLQVYNTKEIHDENFSVISNVL